MRHVGFTTGEISFLYYISSGLFAVNKPKDLGAFAEFAGEELNLAGCSIWSQDDDAPGPERLGFYQRQDDVILDYLPNLDYQVACEVIASGEMLVENNIGNKAGFKAGPLCPGLIALPLLIEQKAAGALCLWVGNSAGNETAVSLYLAREMARLLGFSLGRLIGRRAVASNQAGPEINQEDVLWAGMPRPIPVIPGISLGVRTLEAESRDGDFCEFIVTKSNKLVILLGGIIGQAAAVLPFKYAARPVLRLLAQKDVSPGAACSEMNGLLYDELHWSGALLGMIYASYNPLNGDLIYSNAGYNKPLVISEKTGEVAFRGTSEPYIGLTEKAAYAQKSLRLKSGDIAVFFSNGVSELLNGQGVPYPRERLVQTVQKYFYFNAPSLLDCLVLDMHQFLGERRPLGHVTLAVLKVE